MGGKNMEGYSDPTAADAIGRVSREEKLCLKEMCSSCIHQDYCSGAYKKDHWCGKHTERSQQ